MKEHKSPRALLVKDLTHRREGAKTQSEGGRVYLPTELVELVSLILGGHIYLH
jgi:hypothetical protein